VPLLSSSFSLLTIPPPPPVLPRPCHHRIDFGRPPDGPRHFCDSVDRYRGNSGQLFLPARQPQHCGWIHRCVFCVCLCLWLLHEGVCDGVVCVCVPSVCVQKRSHHSAVYCRCCASLLLAPSADSRLPSLLPIACYCARFPDQWQASALTRLQTISGWTARWRPPFPPFTIPLLSSSLRWPALWPAPTCRAT